MSIECVAIVGPENEPLFLKSYRGGAASGVDAIRSAQSRGIDRLTDAEDALKYDLLVHRALDQLDLVTGGGPAASRSGAAGASTPLGAAAAAAAQKKKKDGLPSSFLGLLLPIEDIKVHGYITQTKIKFLVLVEDEVHAISDASGGF